MRALEKSTGKTSGELEKMMEQGQLTAEYIKPLVMAMGELAEANGAYEKALRKLGTVENRLKTTAGLSAAKIAEAGFTKGLINLYETLMNSMNENGETLTRIGKIYEKIFNGLSHVVKGAVAVIESFVRVMESAWWTLQWGIDNPVESLLVVLPIIAAGFKQLGAAIAFAFRGPMLAILGIIGALDEIRAYFDEDVTGLFDDENWTPEQKKREHAERRKMFGRATPEDLKLLGVTEGQGINRLTGEKVDLDTEILGLKFNLGQAAKGLMLGATGSAIYDSVMGNKNQQPANVTFNITSTDPKQAADESWRLFSDFFGDYSEAKR